MSGLFWVWEVLFFPSSFSWFLPVFLKYCKNCGFKHLVICALLDFLMAGKTDDNREEERKRIMRINLDIYVKTLNIYYREL